MAELDQALDAVQAGHARILVIRGVGAKAFCSGGDLKELELMRSAAEAASMARRMRATLDRLPQLSIPVIAGLNGDALGGGAELAVACDFRVAASHARIGFAQVTLGIVPAWGATERLAEVARSIANAPPATIAGIKRSVDAVRPHRHPELAAGAIEAFANTWAHPAHWKALDTMEKRRQAKK